MILEQEQEIPWYVVSFRVLVSFTGSVQSERTLRYYGFPRAVTESGQKSLILILLDLL